MRALSALVAVAIIGIVVLAAGTHALSDVNSGGPSAVGYADMKISVKWDVVGDCTIFNDQIVGQCNLSPSQVELRAEEHLNVPNSPATIFFISGLTVTTTCRSDVVASITGHGFPTPVVASSEERSWESGQTVSYSFGHLYFFDRGTFTVSIKLYAYGCWGHNTRQLINTVDRQLYFDGSNDF
jgi:hypothetical protein